MATELEVNKKSLKIDCEANLKSKKGELYEQTKIKGIMDSSRNFIKQ